ncbi:RNA polymerase sigma-70 factor [Mucilaginibacter rubeus]|uniref:RNA polymerase sigma-70 factor n=1 Tax=Mucilaginibacter rubeus TaxID=2027860 RepID=A0A5C1HXA8_9SPHI|nr:RNA polymerase sigma-70 factor [Mucilaginibacter rubeus]QEM10492.1 RNA polymerase sigma-70 factor [Mucilaginibacter rubeus]
MTNKLTDNELWEAVVSDSSRAFVVLYNRYWHKLYQTAKKYLKDDTAAEEIVHDVFVALWQKRHSSKIIDFQKYILVTARYHVYKQLRAIAAEKVEFYEQIPEQPALALVSEADVKLGYEDLQTELTNVLKQLPRRCQEIFWLSRVENLSNDEIAERLNISKRTVENQITIALKFLRSLYPHFSGAAVSLLFIFIL